MPDFERMSLDDLIAWKVVHRRAIRTLQRDGDASNRVYRRRVAEMHLAEASAQVYAAAERSGRTAQEQAQYWLTEKAADNGHRVQAGLYLDATRSK